MSIKELGQYFTINKKLQSFVFKKVKHKSKPLLEPSFGAGHLLRLFKEYRDDYPMTCYEIDETIKPVVTFNENQTVEYGDFMKIDIPTKFKTIIGNPPYVKQSTGNLYLKFIEKCYECLDEDGELIFIVPSDFIKLTRAGPIINKMILEGSFTDFLFPNDESLFDKASIDVVVFRYEKGTFANKALVNETEMFCNVKNGIVTFSDKEVCGKPISDFFNAYVGIVSGRDSVYKQTFGNIDVLQDKDKIEKFIQVKTLPSGDERIDVWLNSHKDELINRKIRKFSEKTWFEWGALRNISQVENNVGKTCIYIRNMTRSKEIAFIDKVQYFGGSLICLIPKNDISKSDMQTIVETLNSENFRNNYTYAGRFKIGHKQICNAEI